ncbi:MAG TPA: GyrI-like domain-containing protein [Anaerolineaceae bacterium]|nr:GyrI-like domain-containing protein [Anaerolineaceae bacterium]
MKANIVHKEAFNVAGLSILTFPADPKIPELWDKLFNSGLFEKLEKAGQGQSLGVCYAKSKEPRFRYMAGLAVDSIVPALATGAEVLHVSAADYLVVPCKGSVPQCIQDGYKYAEKLIAEAGLRMSLSPDFEHYFKGDLNSPDYEMELWLPVEKAAV